ncbi:receptor-type adenylate cyclase GRESAG 4, putative [Trypanosoma brucei brucei TREU927]|uniref:adenylate cyclase n=1 Tax=Trypanosoma brucei brucei (strain 927/4 GUTat10.1) TaxID=185431 RepID=Q583G9_TRYB2|nr:receptor-type adenylate cyclase GRESAG 4, putative [Trypanosoma brucei brucei TREU927]AAX80208.1 receptor-type adenylate cyclase GRESAG 4, putative [Trypanosoma brucei]AAZ10966.1 receptor-type adenylate cyclase GRESAG 4, putative [Trypanosoma brucei brucei TREU927]
MCNIRSSFLCALSPFLLSTTILPAISVGNKLEQLGGPIMFSFTPRVGLSFDISGRRGADNSGLCRPHRLRLATVVMLLLFMAPPALSEDVMTVRVYSLLYNPLIPDNLCDAINAGLNASLASRKWTVAPDVKVELISPTSYKIKPVEVLQVALERHKGEFFVVIGPVGDGQALASLPLLERENLVGFAPSTGSNAMRGWNPHVYFLSASPNAELLTLVRYAVSQLRLLRIGFMYLRGISFGDTEYKMTTSLMSSVGRELCGVFTVDGLMRGRVNDDDFNTAWEQFAETRPQGVIAFAPPAKDLIKFVKRLLSDSRTHDAYLLSSSSLEFALDTWREALEADGAEFFLGQLMLTRTGPLARDTHYQAIRRFQDHMRSYLSANPGVTVFNGTDNFDHDDVDGELMVYGWIAGEVLSQALSSREWLTSRKAFMESLYNQRRYVIDDLVIGDFGGDCKGGAGERGAACNCNQGGNVLYINVVGNDERFHTVQGGTTVFEPSRCLAESVRLYSPLNTLMFLMLDRELAQVSSEALYYGANVLTGNGRFGQSDRLFISMIPSPSNATYLALQSELDTRSVTAVFGVVDDAMLSIAEVAFVDPVMLTPRLHHRGRNVIQLSPTLEQQLFVVVGYVTNTSASAPMSAIVRGADATIIEVALRKIVWMHGGTLQTVAVLDDNATLVGRLPNRGNAFVIGLAPGDPSLLAAHLDRNPDVRVLIPFFDVALMYDELVSAFNGNPNAERVQFATSLPHWADANTSSEIVREFHTALPDSSAWKPLPLLGYAAARFAQAVLPRMEYVTPKTLLDTIYMQSIITADEMRYGPFEEEEEKECFTANDPVPEQGEVCVVNYGATRISMWSLARALNASVPPLTSPVTPLIRYADPNAIKLSSAQLAGVIVGSLVALALFAAPLVVVLYVLRRGARDNDSAPKEPMEPVTLIFTDIESSTAQWAAHPELMPDAVSTHHRLIRSLIVQYGCYEVKTVGDSFMIACKKPFAAAQLASDLQRCFLRHEWGTTAFDDSYREFERQRADDDNEYKAPSARLDPEVYRQLWNGLRVRVGVHTGICDIRRDEVTKGYDYYGRTSNMAARTESVANGGQVLLSRAAYLSLSNSERGQLDVTALGSMSLRGVPKPVEMYQLNAVVGRSFAALRLDREVVEDGDLSSTSFSDTGSLRGVLSGTSQMIDSCLHAVLGTLGPSQRQKLLMPLCERWQVSLPPSSKATWNEEYCEGVIRRIAVKVGRVVDHCAASGSERSASTLRSASLIIISNHGLDGEARTT